MHLQPQYNLSSSDSCRDLFYFLHMWMMKEAVLFDSPSLEILMVLLDQINKLE